MYNHQETNYKPLKRWYKTPESIHKSCPEVDGTCWICCGGHRHAALRVLSWPLIAPLWAKVGDISQKFTEIPLPFELTFFLLNHTSICVASFKQSIIGYRLKTTRACIPLKWKDTSPPFMSAECCGGGEELSGSVKV